MAKRPVRRRQRGASSSNQSGIVPPNQVGETNPSLLANGPDDSLKVEVTYRRVEELKLVRRQLRTHKPKQVDQIVSMIRRCGFINPIIVDADLGIVCGVGRYLAAKQIGLALVPVIEVSHLSAAELRAYAIADNKLVLNDSWDDQLLVIELTELMVEALDLPIELTQFDLVEIDNLLQAAVSDEGAGSVEPDDSEPISCLGDLFQLGQHRLMCGDSRKEESYQTLLGDGRARCVFSDNPYNIKIAGNASGLGKVKHGDFVMASGEMSQREFTGAGLEYIRKERDLQYHQTLYDLLLRQLEAARIDEAKASPTVQMVDPPQIPKVKSWPKPFIFILAGLVIGTMFGCIRVAVIYVYDYAETDPRLRDRYAQVKQAMHLRG